MFSNINTSTFEEAKKRGSPRKLQKSPKANHDAYMKDLEKTIEEQKRMIVAQSKKHEEAMKTLKKDLDAQHEEAMQKLRKELNDQHRTSMKNLEDRLTAEKSALQTANQEYETKLREAAKERNDLDHECTELFEIAKRLSETLEQIRTEHPIVNNYINPRLLETLQTHALRLGVDNHKQRWKTLNMRQKLKAFFLDPRTSRVLAGVSVTAVVALSSALGLKQVEYDRLMNLYRRAQAYRKNLTWWKKFAHVLGIEQDLLDQILAD